ncbi:MAG: DUF3108 domain-containing protein [Planctomycetota bacterium]
MSAIALLLAGSLLAGPTQDPPAPPAGDLLVPRGEGEVPLRVPRDETLTFRVRVDLGLLSAAVGEVTMTSAVRPYQESLLLTPGVEGAAAPRETGQFRIHARGDYSLYSMDATIDTRILPQDWPHLAYRYVHRGSENRRREILVGTKDGRRQSSYRKDTKKGAPEGTRIWKDPRFRDVPAATVDMLTALYLSRSLVCDDLRVLRFPLIDKDRLWQLRLTKGLRRRLETAGGTFDVVEILLEPSHYPGEKEDEEKEEQFQGLFGIHGSIHLWADRRTGIPVRIQGDLPIGPLTLGIDVELASYAGTAPEFQPIVAAE